MQLELHYYHHTNHDFHFFGLFAQKTLRSSISRLKDVLNYQAFISGVVHMSQKPDIVKLHT